jgi:hypothetical protein
MAAVHNGTRQARNGLRYHNLLSEAHSITTGLIPQAQMCAWEYGTSRVGATSPLYLLLL